MLLKFVSHYMFRCIRIFADLFMTSIGIVYLSNKRYLPTLTDPLLLESAFNLTKRIKSGQLKCETLVNAYIERIKVVNPFINALIDDRFELAVKEAQDLDKWIAKELSDSGSGARSKSIEALPLLGIPFTVKDCIAVENLSHTGGLYSRKGRKAEQDNQVVKNLRDAGAIPIGITNVPEFLLWWDSYNKIYGKTNNPYDSSRIPGGSSGGEAALLSSAGSLVGIGTDLGGSVRIPAYFCGIYGHKPTANAIPISHVFPEVGHPEREKYLQIGPLCRYASDLKPMLRGMAGKQSSRLQLDNEIDWNQLRVYYMETDSDPFKTSISTDIKQVMHKVVKFFDTKTDKLAQKVDIPAMKSSFSIWVCALANVDAPYLSQLLTELTGRVNGYLELCKWFVGKSQFRLSTSINVILYNWLNPDKCRKTKKFQQNIDKGVDLKIELDELLGNNGILLYPTLPETAPKHNGTLFKSNNIGYTMAFNITGHPVTQIPLGLTRDGLPVGLQVVSAHFNDYLTVGVAELLEKEFGGWVAPFDIKLSN